MADYSFFGYEVLPDKTGQHEPPEGCVLTLTRATATKPPEVGEEILVYVAVHPMYEENMNAPPKRYCLCRLNRNSMSVNLRVKFGVSDMVFFSIEREFDDEEFEEIDSPIQPTKEAGPPKTPPKKVMGEGLSPNKEFKKEGDGNQMEKEEDDDDDSFVPDPSTSIHLTGYYKVEEDLAMDDSDEDEFLEELKEALGEDVTSEDISKLLVSTSDIEKDEDESEEEEKEREERRLTPPANEKRATKRLDYAKLQEQQNELGDSDDEDDDGDFNPDQEDFDDEEMEQFGADFSLMKKEDVMAMVTGSPKDEFPLKPPSIPQEEEEEEEEVLVEEKMISLPLPLPLPELPPLPIIQKEEKEEVLAAPRLPDPIVPLPLLPQQQKEKKEKKSNKKKKKRRKKKRKKSSSTKSTPTEPSTSQPNSRRGSKGSKDNIVPSKRKRDPEVDHPPNQPKKKKRKKKKRKKKNTK